MTPEQWRRVNDLYHAALDLPPERRSGFVIDRASDDGTVARELQRLLEIDPDRTAAVDRAAVPEGHFGQFFGAPILLNGDRIADRYRIERELGAGGMGQVYEAFDEELNARIAVKIIRPELAGEPKVVARFKQEVQLARQVTHPNVCRAYDLVRAKHRDRDLLFLCMEYVEGETLSAKLRRDGRMKLSEAEPIITQIAAGLQAAHTAGIVHRDLKCGNVFLSKHRDGELRVVLADFGLAGNLVREEGATQQTSTGWGIGTPAYMAPEQVEGGKIGPPADIYALGIVMYEMATGHVPYEGQTPLQVAVRRLREKPRPPRELDSSVDPKWENAILRCLEIDPADRFAAASAIPAALRQGRLMPRAPRLRTLKGLAPAALVSVVVLAAGGWVLTRQPKLSPEAARWYELGVTALHESAPLTARKRFEQAIAVEPSAALPHARLAEAFLDLDMADRARDELVRAAQLAPDRWRSLSSDLHLIAGIQSRALRDFPKAIQEFTPLTREGAASDRSSAWLDVGRVHAEAGETALAVKAFEESAKLDRQSAAARYQQALMMARQQKIDKAVSLFDDAQRLFELAGNNEGVADVLTEKGRVLRDSRRLSEAQASIAQALTLARTTGSRSQEVKALFAESTVAIRGGDTVGAESRAQLGLELARRHALEVLSIRGLNDLGFAALTQYKLKEAQIYMRQAADLAERARSGQGLAQAQMNLANLAIRMGDAPGALPLVRQATAFYRSGNFREQILLGGLLEIDTLLAIGLHKEALSATERLRSDASAAGSDINVARAIERKAYIHHLQGDFRASAIDYRKACDLHRAGGRRALLAYALVNLGNVLASVAEGSQATQWAEAQDIILSLGRSGEAIDGRLSQVRAEDFLRRGLFVEAESAARAALSKAATSSGRQAVALSVLASSLALQGRIASARQVAKTIDPLLDQQSVSEVYLPVRIELARVALLAGDRRSALENAVEAEVTSTRLGLLALSLRASALLRALGKEQAYEASRERYAAVVGEPVATALGKLLELKEPRKALKP